MHTGQGLVEGQLQAFETGLLKNPGQLLGGMAAVVVRSDAYFHVDDLQISMNLPAIRWAKKYILLFLFYPTKGGRVKGIAATSPKAHPVENRRLTAIKTKRREKWGEFVSEHPLRSRLAAGIIKKNIEITVANSAQV